jgi:serine/threonine protein phosphatase PrpC
VQTYQARSARFFISLLTRLVYQKSDSGKDDRVIFGVSSMQGWRISMEDAHACILNLKPEGQATTNGENTGNDRRVSFFGVYDGHGGDKVAVYAGENLHHIIAKQEAFKSGDLEKAIKDGFLATDRAILSGTRTFPSHCRLLLWLTNPCIRPKVRRRGLRMYSVCRYDH